MATRKGGLGKGLDSLIADKVGTSNEKTDAKNEVMVNINKVEPNKEQPRKNFDEDALLELSESIKQMESSKDGRIKESSCNHQRFNGTGNRRDVTD